MKSQVTYHSYQLALGRSLTSSADISDTAYRIAIKLEVTNEHGDTTEPPTIVLSVSYPETYPDIAPHLDLSNPPNAPKHPLLDVSEDKTQLLKSLDGPIEENLGMAMVFTLVSTLKEAAEQLIIERQGALQAQKDQKAAQADEEENRKFHGTVVTRDRFIEWREKFLAEMAEKERKDKDEREVEDKKKRSGKPEEKKMTGRQLWESGLVGKVDEDEEDGEDAIEGLERLKVTA